MASPLAPAVRGELTVREREVIDTYAEVWSFKGVAERLGISVFTVRQHADSARRKLGAATIGQAVVFTNERSPRFRSVTNGIPHRRE